MMDFFADTLFLKALIILTVVLVGLWGASIFIKQFQMIRSNQDTSKLTRVLDSCYLDGARKLVIFSCPFGQGVVLISPRQDQLVLFDHTIPSEVPEKAHASAVRKM